MSMILTVGSPTYSLIITCLNGSYVASRFTDIIYPNSHQAARILAGLQQVPLRIVAEDALLASLVVLPQNDEWWKTIRSHISYEHTWFIPAVTNFAWVVVAYLLTVITAFTVIGDINTESDGPAVGSLWLWVRVLMVSPHLSTS